MGSGALNASQIPSGLGTQWSNQLNGNTASRAAAVSVTINCSVKCVILLTSICFGELVTKKQENNSKWVKSHAR